MTKEMLEGLGVNMAVFALRDPEITLQACSQTAEAIYAQVAADRAEIRAFEEILKAGKLAAEKAKAEAEAARLTAAANFTWDTQPPPMSRATQPPPPPRRPASMPNMPQPPTPATQPPLWSPPPPPPPRRPTAIPAGAPVGVGAAAEPPSRGTRPPPGFGAVPSAAWVDPAAMRPPPGFDRPGAAAGGTAPALSTPGVHSTSGNAPLDRAQGSVGNAPSAFPFAVPPGWRPPAPVPRAEPQKTSLAQPRAEQHLPNASSARTPSVQPEPVGQSKTADQPWTQTVHLAQPAPGPAQTPGPGWGAPNGDRRRGKGGKGSVVSEATSTPLGSVKVSLGDLLEAAARKAKAKEASKTGAGKAEKPPESPGAFWSAGKGAPGDSIPAHYPAAGRAGETKAAAPTPAQDSGDMLGGKAVGRAKRGGEKSADPEKSASRTAAIAEDAEAAGAIPTGGIPAPRATAARSTAAPPVGNLADAQAAASRAVQGLFSKKLTPARAPAASESTLAQDSASSETPVSTPGISNVAEIPSRAEDTAAKAQLSVSSAAVPEAPSGAAAAVDAAEAADAASAAAAAAAEASEEAADAADAAAAAAAAAAEFDAAAAEVDAAAAAAGAARKAVSRQEQKKREAAERHLRQNLWRQEREMARRLKADEKKFRLAEEAAKEAAEEAAEGAVEGAAEQDGQPACEAKGTNGNLGQCFMTETAAKGGSQSSGMAVFFLSRLLLLLIRDF